MSRDERFYSAWLLLIAGWASRGLAHVFDSELALWAALVLFVGALYGFTRFLIDEFRS